MSQPVPLRLADSFPPADHLSHAQWVSQVVVDFERPLLSYARNLAGGNIELARDIVQDTFLRLWSADRASVAPHLAQWLYTVCRNRALDIRRKDSRMRNLDLPQNLAPPAQAAPRLSDPSDHAATGLAGASLADLMLTLSPKHQEVLRLKFQAGLSYKEIAAVMQITVSHVGVLLHVALKTIRDRLSPSADSLPAPSTARA